MWDAVRKIFRHDETPDDLSPRDVTPPTVDVPSPSGLAADDGATVTTRVEAAGQTSPAGPMPPVQDTVSVRAGATELMGDAQGGASPLPAPERLGPGQTVRISPPDHAPQGLAADVAPLAAVGPAERAAAPTTPVAAIDSTMARDVGVAQPAGRQRPPVDAYGDAYGDAGRDASSPALSPPGAEAAPGDVLVPAPVAEPSLPDASPPVMSVTAPDTPPDDGDGGMSTSEPVSTVAFVESHGDAAAPTGELGDASLASNGATPSVSEADTTSVGVTSEQGERVPPAVVGTNVTAAPTATDVATHVAPAPVKEVEETVATPAPMGETVETQAAREPATLAPGTVVAGRYAIAALVNEAGDTRTYRAADARSYEQCWSCGSAQNGPANRFCQNCGAPIQNHPVALVQTAAPSGQPGEVEHDGLYLHVQPERRPFGVEGVGIEVGAHSAEGPHHPNEDSYWYTTRTLCANSGRRSLAVVLLADGMGGYAPGSGLISSRIAATAGASITGALDARGDAALPSDEAEAIVRAGIAAANKVVLDEIARSGEMGATLVGAVVHGDTAYIANVGDSRAYYVNPQGKAMRITRDQSLVAQELGQGGLSEDDLYTAPGNNIVLHAVGEQGVETAADWYEQPLEPDSLLILCSDGYWKTMRGTLIPEGVSRESNRLNEVARHMVDDALTRGSDDNTTVLLIAIS